MRTLLRSWAIALLWMLYLPGLVASQELAPANPNRVMAAFLRNFAQALGDSGQIPVLLAAWSPPLAAVMLSLGLLLHLEDG